MSLVDRVRALLGDDAVDVAATPDGVPRVAPGSPDAVTLLLGTAREEGWRVRVEGAGTWLPADAPADLALTTRRLDKVPAIEPQDLSATAEAGIGCDLLRQQLADRGTWLALDPPGLAGRTLGSVVATATAGPLRQGFGAVRDHVLGVTFVTGDGRLVQSGGRVVKNVAGYDLTKLEAGGFGAFGVIVLVHLRLRALPRADQTFVLAGTRTQATSCSTCCSIRWATNGCRRAPASGRSAGRGTPRSTGCAACGARSRGSRCRSPWSAPPGRSGARWATSAPIAKAWARSSLACDAPSTPAKRLSWRSKAPSEADACLSAAGSRRSTPASTAAFASRRAPPSSPPATKPIARADASS